MDKKEVPELPNGGTRTKMETLATQIRTHCTWRRELIPIKMILFLYTGGMIAFLPFLTLQMRQIGITVKEMAVIHAFLPVASLLGPPTSGLVADVFGKYRHVLCGNILTTIILHCMLLQVPPRPSNTLSLSCWEGGHALTWEYCSPCHLRAGGESYTDLPVTIKRCKQTCPEMSRDLSLCLHGADDTTCHSLNSTNEIRLNASLISWQYKPDTTTTTTTTITTTATTTTTNTTLPPPPPQSLPLLNTTTATCGHTFALIRNSSSSSSSSSSSGEEPKEEEEQQQQQLKSMKETNTQLNELITNKHTNKKHRQTSEKTTTTENSGHPQNLIKQNEATKKAGNFKGVLNGESSKATDMRGSGDDKLDSWSALTCPVPTTCAIECKVEGLPACDDPDDPSQTQLTFWVYFAVRLCSTFFLASSFTMMDATTLALVKQHGAEFGKQRILATIGQATVPLLAGILVDAHSASLDHSDYMPSIYMGCSLALVATILVARLDVQVERGSDSVVEDLKKLVTKVEIDLFLFMILVLGSNWGFIESYLFLYLKELHAPNYLLGLTMTVGCITGVPIMYVADMVIDKMGRPAIFILSFFGYAARHFGYAFMNDPWIVFPYELLEIFTYQIMWVAAATYCHVLAPKGLLATMTGLAGATHYSMGRGLGSLLGGYLIDSLGLQETFKIYGYISLTGGILYILVHFLYLRRKVNIKGKGEGGDSEEEDDQQEDKITEEQLPMIHLGLRRGSEGLAPSLENIRIKRK